MIFKTVVTPGVLALNLPDNIVGMLIDEAIKQYKKNNYNYMLVFKPKDNIVYVENGNCNVIRKIKISLPEKIWNIIDDYGTYNVITLLLPSKY